MPIKGIGKQVKVKALKTVKQAQFEEETIQIGLRVPQDLFHIIRGKSASRKISVNLYLNKLLNDLLA